jgi:hypothetical protein
VSPNNLKRRRTVAKQLPDGILARAISFRESLVDYGEFGIGIAGSEVSAGKQRDLHHTEPAGRYTHKED